MSVTIVGTVSGFTTAVWGTSVTNMGAGSAATAYGTVISCRVAKRAKQTPRLDTEGETVGLVVYDQNDQVDLEIEAAASASMPAIGDQLAIAGLTGVVALEPETLYVRGGMKKFRLRGTKWSAMSFS